MPFHPLKDLALITQVVSVPEILVVNESVPVKTLAELIALAKAQPGKLVFASTGHGGMPHMAMELLKLTAEIQLVHAPYTGAAPAVNDLLGGHVQMMFADVPVLLGSIQSGKLRALRSAAARVSPACPRWLRRQNLACRRSKPTTGTVSSRRLPYAAAGPRQAPFRCRRSRCTHRGQGQAGRAGSLSLSATRSAEFFSLCQKRDRALGQGHHCKAASRSSERGRFTARAATPRRSAGSRRRPAPDGRSPENAGACR